MVFCSQFFLCFFLPLCLVAYYLTPKKYKNYTFLFFSLVFYFWGETRYVWLIVLSIVFNYCFGLLLSKSKKSFALLSIGVLANLSILVYYKYAFFILNTIKFEGYKIEQFILPLGISFYTFHSISYLVDIYRGKAQALNNFPNMALYIINFAQLVAGPIVRYHDIETQLTHRKHFWLRFSNGIKLFIIGLSKKMLVANTMGQFADAIFNTNQSHYGVVYAWLGIIAYTLQIYFDFSGYSDMAIGLGKLFGFEFKPNFKLPYASTSIRDFWQRWHISLSSWFRDYVYIPLGGNKKGAIRTSVNLLIVFVLCGFWHGANFTFIVWGLFHGFFLIVERIIPQKNKTIIPSIFKSVYVWLVIMIGWVFFRSANLQTAVAFIKKLILITPNCSNYPEINSYSTLQFGVVLVLGFLLSINCIQKGVLYILKRKVVSFAVYRNFSALVLMLLFALCFIEIISNSYNPFIYYRF
jgi:alginate O-acetyltransferase complex protein AlgI